MCCYARLCSLSTSDVRGTSIFQRGRCDDPVFVDNNTTIIIEIPQRYKYENQSKRGYPSFLGYSVSFVG